MAFTCCTNSVFPFYYFIAEGTACEDVVIIVNYTKKLCTLRFRKRFKVLCLLFPHEDNSVLNLCFVMIRLYFAKHSVQTKTESTKSSHDFFFSVWLLHQFQERATAVTSLLCLCDQCCFRCARTLPSSYFCSVLMLQRRLELRRSPNIPCLTAIVISPSHPFLSTPPSLCTSL